MAALTEIKDDSVYSFMVETVEDYIKNPRKYEGWFDIDHFTYNFSEQSNKAALPLLEKLLDEVALSSDERLEIESTIECLTDPEKFRENLERMAGQNIGPEPGSCFCDICASDVHVCKPAKKAQNIGRNDRCPCGSGKKYKKCCMGKDE